MITEEEQMLLLHHTALLLIQQDFKEEQFPIQAKKFTSQGIDC